jgi:hypothetical protein
MRHDGQCYSIKGGRMTDDETPDPDNARSPAPDAAPEDNPEPDALKDADIKSGTGDAEEENPTREGVAGPASGFTPEAGGG